MLDHVFFSETEFLNDGHGYWSNTEGWTTLAQCDRFRERECVSRPVGADHDRAVNLFDEVADIAGVLADLTQFSVRGSPLLQSWDGQSLDELRERLLGAFDDGDLLDPSVILLEATWQERGVEFEVVLTAQDLIQALNADGKTAFEALDIKQLHPMDVSNLGNRIPVIGRESMTREGLTKWFIEMNQRGLGFHPEDSPWDIVNGPTGSPVFWPAEVSTIEKIKGLAAEMLGSEAWVEIGCEVGLLQNGSEDTINDAMAQVCSDDDRLLEMLKAFVAEKGLYHEFAAYAGQMQKVPGQRQT